jgi:hypothetical protein
MASSAAQFGLPNHEIHSATFCVPVVNTEKQRVYSHTDPSIIISQRRAMNKSDSPGMTYARVNI